MKEISKKILNDKQNIISLYLEKELTTYQIAEIYQVNRSTISRNLKKWGINLISEQRKFRNIKKIPLNQEQRELIIGSLLGDGCIALHGRKNKSYRFIVSHCEKQKEYLLFKKSILGKFTPTIRKYTDKRENSIIFNITSITHNSFKSFENLFYDNRKKIIKPEIINYITPFIIAIWYMDDGSLNQKISMRFSTDCFSYQENKILKDMFKIKYDINVKICEYTRHDKKFYYLSLNKRNSILLQKIIEPYIVDCMKYKLLDSSSTTTCQTSFKQDDDIV